MFADDMEITTSNKILNLLQISCGRVLDRQNPVVYLTAFKSGKYIVKLHVVRERRGVFPETFQSSLFPKRAGNHLITNFR